MMLPRFLIPSLQAGHGLLNLSLFAAFLYQGRLGWLIRRNRQTAKPQDVRIVRRHRTLGPILTVLLPAGYLTGLFLSYLHNGVWAKYPFHLAGGSLLVVATGATWLISRNIRGAQSPWRTPHFLLGLPILIIFLIQVFLGLNVLL